MNYRQLRRTVEFFMPFFQIRPRHFVVFWVTCTVSFLSSSSMAATNEVISEQRKHYLAAKDALDKRRMKSFRWHRDQLTTYPLKPYLDYYELNRRLSRLPYDDVEKFLTQQDGSLLASRLRKKWLYQLAIKKQWNSFRTYYSDEYTDTELRCYSLEARFRTGEKEALKDVAELWNVGKSQPRACNNIFKVWLNSEHFSQEVAWQRFLKAMDSNRVHLAEYIAKKFDPEYKRYSKLLIEVHHYPARLERQQKFQEQSEKMQAVILHGIKRYAKREPRNALRNWHKYDAQQLFSDDQRFQTQQYLASRLIRKGYQGKAENLLANITEVSSEKLIEGLIREFLKEQDWKKVLTYINKLPNEAQASDRWQYWRARAMEQDQILQVSAQSAPSPSKEINEVTPSAKGTETDATETNATDLSTASQEIKPLEIYTKLALERGYYGFLSADRIGRQYQLSDAPTLIDQQQVVAIATRPSTKRAKELIAIGDDLNARREWFHMTQQLNISEHIAAAKLSHQWGWHHRTIISLANAKHWDDLQMRFPLAYNQQVLKTAQKLQVSPLLLFAIARQESAFAVDARSPAGAMGLMQLMPSTAKMTARKAGVRYKKFDLLKPDKNILLGSHYINSLLKQFNGNRILAAAAYNAGPHRVKKWLKRSDEQLAYDIWIETIPFKETRHYVQNILAYSVIYGYRMGTTPSLLSSNEANQRL